MRRLAALLLLLAGCSAPTDLDKFLPKQTRWILEAPDQVTAYRIDIDKFDRRKTPTGPDGSITYDQIPVTSEAAVEGPERVELLRLFADPASFEFVGKGCKPMMGVKFRFRRGDSVATFYFCFQCLVIERSEDGKNPEGWADFDPSRKAFLKLVQLLFPKDSDIKNLK